jgi:hypothetical protein
MVCTPVINEAKRIRQEDHKFEVSLGYKKKKRASFHLLSVIFSTQLIPINPHD